MFPMYKGFISGGFPPGANCQCQCPKVDNGAGRRRNGNFPVDPAQSLHLRGGLGEGRAISHVVGGPRPDYWYKTGVSNGRMAGLME
jgi:hypothetical protein